MFEPGQKVVVAYTGYHIGATVLEETRYGEKPYRGWIAIRQDTDSRPGMGYAERDVPEDERPEFLAAEEFVSLPGEPIKPSPLEAMARFWDKVRVQ